METPPSSPETDEELRSYSRDHTSLGKRLLVGALMTAAIIGGLLALMGFLEKNKPVAKVEPTVRPLLTVVTAEPKRENVPIELLSEGQIQAARNTLVASEVTGKVLAVSPQFKVGEIFQEGDILVEIDPGDYQNTIAQAAAALADANVTMENEKALSAQALRDWNNLSPGKKPTDLVLRKPQQDSAQARVSAAAAALEKARRDLEKTKIKAPFTGKIRSIRTEIGSYLAPGAAVADFFATGHYEVPLSFPLDDLAFLRQGSEEGVDVTLEAELAGENQTWTGRIVRRTGEMDRDTRTITVVAELKETDKLLQPGLFLKAKVPGVTLQNVIRVPRLCFLDSERVIVVDKDNRIAFRKVPVVRKEKEDAFVTGGFSEGDRLCLTRLANPLEGLQVEVSATKGSPSFTNP